MNDKDITSEVEYAIWGVIPDDIEESLLCTRIESSEQAHTTRDELVNKFNITKARIQTIDMNECPSKLFNSKDIINGNS